MPSTISAGTTAGTAIAIAGDTTGNLAFQTNGTTTAMTIDTSQNVGIGTASPGVKLDVSGGDFRIQQSASTARQRFVAGSNQWNVETSNSTNGYAIYDAAAGQLRAFIDTSGNFQFNSGYGSTATAYGCRAWVNFNGTGTPSIRASGNVSSIGDNDVGDYYVNYTNAMPNANCGVIATTKDTVGVNAGGIAVLSSQDVNRARLLTCGTDGTKRDYDYVACAVFR